ncbi:unnamed protein product (macronuclear) [Paramecium tetraurelia]|uniref:Chromosome undetermined scaffold_1, whole genome shotgun sequence n=1 Tax=Paramecium tetraurelia TaxID=5888 RepID=Q6BFZ0_PARTE|nr:hypothetical protein [Paramecium tetraurelia strain d4-2]XP_001423248.1 uncharacterized protein GSPATT00000285001 [Paramecium tetraurelia]CAH03430.1 hypothetical protein, Zn-finger domain [Paramecium tetraurelia]CAK55850.1 unnamed protein product [Paramecium tetraurelia]|eukprot:XP_001423248.1 hypothetical protein (macronuclear) [Paramecium tetraurelia strain d4-2]
MEHKKLLENVMIDLLKDPSCPIYQYQDWQLINICQQLQIQNFSNIKDQDFQKKFAQFFINYLEAENEITNILEQSSIKRSDSKKINENYSNQNNQPLQSKSLTKSNQESNKQKQDQLDMIRNKKKVKLKQSNPSDLLEIEENICTHSSANLHQMISQGPKLSQYSFDPLIDSHQDQIICKEKTQKITSKEQGLIESIFQRQVKDHDLEPTSKNKKQSLKDSKNQVQSNPIQTLNDFIRNKKQLNVDQNKEERENNRAFVDNKTIEQYFRKNRQIQIQKKPSRAIIDSSPEEGEIVIQISDSESQKQKNIQDQQKLQGKYQMDELIHVKSNKIQQKKNNTRQKTFNQYKDQDIIQGMQVEQQINQPQSSILQNQEQSLTDDKIQFEILKQKQLLEKQYTIIQSQPPQQNSNNYFQNQERNNLINSLSNTSNSILQQINSQNDIQNPNLAAISNPVLAIPKEPSNVILQNQQFNQNDQSNINLEKSNKFLRQKNSYLNKLNQQQINQRQLQGQMKFAEKQNQQINQTNNPPQSLIFSVEDGVNLERLREKKPKIESNDTGNNNISQQAHQYLKISTNWNQCNYCKQIDGKVKLIEIENEANICSSCLLEKLNPFKKIVQTLGFLEYQYQQRSKSRIHLDFTIAQELFRNPELLLEIRCVMMNKNGLTDFTFPNSCTLLINGVTIKEFKPLIEKSCLRKRKDHCILINLDEFKNIYEIQRKYTFTCVETIPDSKMRQEIPNQIYIFGLFVVQNQRLEQIIQSIVNQSILSQIKTDVQKHEIKVDKSKVSLVCQYSFDLIKIPARGEFCQHQQCFSLNSYLEMMIHAEHMKWICPICKKNSISLRIDHYQWGIIKKIQQLNIKVDQITVDQNGTLDSKDPFYAIIQNNQINGYNDLISQGYTNFERSSHQFDNDDQIMSQNKMQTKGGNESNAILID